VTVPRLRIRQLAEHGLSYLGMLQHAVALALLALLGVRLVSNMRFLRWVRRQAALPAAQLPRVSVLIPARNEAGTITACVTSLLDQQYTDVEIIVLDDGSTDGTGQMLDALSARHPRLRVLHTCDDPPPGWTGKNFACHRLAAQASGDWLLFTDADTLHAPDSILQGITAATSLDTALVSAMPHQRTESWSEHILVSFIVDFLPLIAVDLRALWRGSSGQTVANGQYLLVNARRYRATGGHTAIRSALIDDFALARQFRARGFSVALVDGTHMLSCRMYRRASAVWDGFSKNLLGAVAPSSAGGYSQRQPLWRSLWPSPLFAWCYACLFVIPFCGVAFGTRKALAGVEIAGLYALRGVAGWYLRRPLHETIVTPLAGWGVMALGLRTLYQRWRKRPIMWKGRHY
jgi:chlorobactene glucosyltransferase